MCRKCSRGARLHCVHDGRQAVCRRTAHVLSVYAQSETHVGIAIIRRESRGESVISRTLVCMCMLCSLWRNVCILSMRVCIDGNVLFVPIGGTVHTEAMNHSRDACYAVFVQI